MKKLILLFCILFLSSCAIRNQSPNLGFEGIVTDVYGECIYIDGVKFCHCKDKLHVGDKVLIRYYTDSRGQHNYLSLL